MEGSASLLGKSANQFKQMIKYYETKNFKKALKKSEDILERFPKHGETLSMKGLILNYLGKKVEAMTHAKMGLMSNLTSGMCWHTLGVIHKQERNYEEAMKCFVQAYNYDMDNGTIVRDLSLLQLQCRSFTEFKGTRFKVFQAKPNVQTNWIAYILALHLCSDHARAI